MEKTLETLKELSKRNICNMSVDRLKLYNDLVLYILENNADLSKSDRKLLSKLKGQIEKGCLKAKRKTV